MLNLDSSALQQFSVNPEGYFELFDSFPCYAYAKDIHGRYLMLNKNLADDNLLGNPKDFIGNTDYDMPHLPHHLATGLQSNDQSIIQAKLQKQLLETVTVSKGRKIEILSYKSPLFSSTQKVIGVVGFSIIKNEINESSNLSKRQVECLTLLVKGFTQKQIALELKLSIRTVEHYLETVKNKLNCQTRSELISAALKLEIVKNMI